MARVATDSAIVTQVQRTELIEGVDVTSFEFAFRARGKRWRMRLEFGRDGDAVELVPFGAYRGETRRDMVDFDRRRIYLLERGELVVEKSMPMSEYLFAREAWAAVRSRVATALRRIARERQPASR